MKFYRLVFPFVFGTILLAVIGLGLHNASAPRALAAPTATTWYVDAATGNDADDCLTPATACLTVGGAVGKAASGDTIQIAPGTYTENLDINFDLTFVGAGMDATFLDGGQAGRTLVTASSHITLTHLTVQNGVATGSGFAGSGGGIYNYAGLVLDNVRVWQNAAQDGGAGIFTSGDLIIQNSEIISNTAQGVGGAVYIWSNGGVTITESLILSNTASQGGGIFAIGDLNIADSTLAYNASALFGGGLVVLGNNANVDIQRSTFAYNQTDGYGAGIVNNAGILTLTNVTISNNTGNNYTGLANISTSAQTTVVNSTFADNQASNSGVGWGGIGNISDGIISLQNTLLSNNDERNCLSEGSWTSLGHNLSSDNYCNFTQPGDLQNTDPELAPLADYSGPTWTHALYPTSPALDSGTNTGCPLTDQRGVARPFDGDNDGTATCDRGAVETRHQFIVSDVTLLEGSVGTTNAVFTVTLAPTSTLPVTVSYTTIDGNAQAGSDYTTASGTLTFAPGESLQTVPVAITGDTDDEPNETFILQLSNPLNADLLDGAGLGTIIDDDGLPTLNINPVSLEEGNSGSAPMTFIVTLSPVHFQTVTVDYATSDDTATAGADYQPANGTLTFAPNETSKEITVNILGDLVDEGESEVFHLNLSNPTNANVNPSTAEGTILDNDIAQLNIGPTREIYEGNTGHVTLVFSATLTIPTSFPVTVDYYTQSGVGGTFATPGEDYEETSGTLTFAPGESEQTFTITIYSDYAVEEDEHFGVYLTNASPISIYGSATTGYILNDDDGVIRVFLPVIVK
ncbi:MAG: hypothetical protein Fur0022_44550 [Anaerolineales bacterium]